MSKKVIKYFFELVFIFIIPLLILVINCNYENTIEYDNNGNFQSTEKHFEFTTPFNYTRQIVENVENPIKATIIENDTTYNYYTDYIQISSSNERVIYYKVNNSSAVGTTMYIITYDTDKNVLQEIYCSLTDTEQTITLNSNVKYIKLARLTSQNLLSIEQFNNIINVYNHITTYIYTIWGRLKNVFIEDLELQDNFVIDFIISYTILWFIMFIIWHIIYLLFDKLFHLRKE